MFSPVDTNVVISALTAGGTPQKIIQAWIMGEFLAVMSTELRQEINTVFNRSKFIKPDKRRRALLGTLFNQALMVLPQPLDKIIFPDENDHFLLELAATAEATIIVTGDKLYAAFFRGCFRRLFAHKAGSNLIRQ